jgi:microcystin-dependent protein
MGNGYTRQSAAEIAPGETITDTALEAEFDGIEAAFHGSTGHTHDGTTGEGPAISLTTSISGVLPVANGGIAGIHKLNAAVAPAVTDDSGDGYAVGSVWIDTTADISYECLDASVGAAVWRRHQTYDADLAAIAGLTSAADKGIQFTGAGTAATYDLTAFAKTVLDDADAVTARATLGTTIGTHVQAWNTNLDDWATVSPADYYDAAGVDANFQPLDADLTAIAALSTTAGGRGLLTLSDPGADRIVFWDDSAGAFTHLTLGTGLTITTTTLNADTTVLASTTQAGTIEIATDAEMLTGTATDKAVVVSNITYVNLMPVGGVIPYAGTAAPNRWLLCYGQAVSRTTYAELFAVTSTTYGAGDGSTTFNLPDLRGRVVAGQDDMGGVSANRLTAVINGDTLGVAGGADTVTLITAELPSHTHTQQGSFVSGANSVDHTHTQQGTFASGVNSVDHTHTFGIEQNSPGGSLATTGNARIIADTSGATTDTTSVNSVDHTHNTTISGQTGNNSVDHTHTTTISGATTATGSGTAHDNVQPTIVLNYIIYTGAA